jgi:hypothetical protein
MVATIDFHMHQPLAYRVNSTTWFQSKQTKHDVLVSQRLLLDSMHCTTKDFYKHEKKCFYKVNETLVPKRFEKATRVRHKDRLT